MSDDSAHNTGMTVADPKLDSLVFGSNEEARARVKVEQDLEGAISPFEPVTPNPSQRHRDPHHYRYRELPGRLVYPAPLFLNLYCQIG